MANKENEEKNREYGMWEGTCISCDLIGRIDDLGLCKDCSDKLERDLIRQRDFERTAARSGISHEQQEMLREEVIKNYGKALEFLGSEKLQKRRGNINLQFITNKSAGMNTTILIHVELC